MVMCRARHAHRTRSLLRDQLSALCKFAMVKYPAPKYSDLVAPACDDRGRIGPRRASRPFARQSSPPLCDPTPDEVKSCEGVTFSPSLKYRETTRTYWMSRPLIPGERLRAPCCCSSPGKFSPARTRFHFTVPLQDVACALPRQRHGRRANGLSAGAGKPVARRAGTSRRRSPGSARTSICSGQSPADRRDRLLRRRFSRGKLSGPPGIEEAVTAWPAWYWCRGITAQTRMRVQPKRLFWRPTRANTRSARPFPASFTSRRRSCWPGRCWIRRVSLPRAKSSGSFSAAFPRIARTPGCWRAAMARLPSSHLMSLASGLAEFNDRTGPGIEARGLPGGCGFRPALAGVLRTLVAPMCLVQALAIGLDLAAD